MTPQEISADKAYDSGANLEILESKGIVGTIPLTAKLNHCGPDLFTVDHFQYNATSETLTCPAGCVTSRKATAVFVSEKAKMRGKIFSFNRSLCEACRLKPRCHPGHRGRSVYISYYHPLYEAMKTRLQSDAGKEAQRNRMRIEHRIADLARNCGMRRARYRGLKRIRVHVLLSAIASNIKRMTRLLCAKPPDPVPTN